MEYEGKFIEINSDFIKNNEAFDIIEPLWWSVSIYDGEDKYIEDLSKFTKEQKYVFAIEWYLSEVNNGGHDQFYYNSTGIVWEDAMMGFREIGLDQFAEIIEESAKRMGGSPSKNREKRQDELEKCEPDFTDLDDRLYSIEGLVEDKLMQYIREYEEKFYFKGEVIIPK